MNARQPLRPGEVFSRREPLQDYLAQTGYASSSTLRRFARGATRPFEGARLGEALHAFLLEPESFDAAYLALDGSVPAGRRLSEDEAHRREWLSPEQIAGLRWVREAVNAYSKAPLAQWLRQGEKELSIYWSDESGARWRARPDCFTQDVILELKSTSDVRPDAFSRTRDRLGYDLQAAHYLEAVERLTGRRPRFIFLTVELIPPRSLWLHELAPRQIDEAARKLDACADATLDRRGPAPRDGPTSASAFSAEGRAGGAPGSKLCAEWLRGCGSGGRHGRRGEIPEPAQVRAELRRPGELGRRGRTAAGHLQQAVQSASGMGTAAAGCTA